MRGAVPTGAVLRAQTPSALDAIRAAVRREVESHAADSAFILPMPAILVSGMK